MNTRILSGSLFCAALLCPALLSSCTANVRPEVATHLEAALVDARHDFSAGAMQQIAAAEAVPNQTDEEKNNVAQVKARVSQLRRMSDRRLLTSTNGGVLGCEAPCRPAPIELH